MTTLRSLIGLIMSLLLFALFVPLAAPVAARTQADECGGSEFGNFSYKVKDNGDGSDTATYTFRPTRSEIAALECAGPQLVVRFPFLGYETRDGETDYEFGSSSLPTPDGQLEEVDNDEVVLWTAINVDDLVAGQRQDVSVRFWGFYAIDPYEERDHFLFLESAAGEWYEESYVGECDDDLADAVHTDKGTYCMYLYDDPVRLGEHEFVYSR